MSLCILTTRYAQDFGVVSLYVDTIIVAISRNIFGGQRLTAFPAAFYGKLLQGFAHKFTLRETQPPLPHDQYWFHSEVDS